MLQGAALTLLEELAAPSGERLQLIKDQAIAKFDELLGAGNPAAALDRLAPGPPPTPLRRSARFSQTTTEARAYPCAPSECNSAGQGCRGELQG